jgi:hypothetical protein
MLPTSWVGSLWCSWFGPVTGRSQLHAIRFQSDVHSSGNRPTRVNTNRLISRVASSLTVSIAADCTFSILRYERQAIFARGLHTTATHQGGRESAFRIEKTITG